MEMKLHTTNIEKKLILLYTVLLFYYANVTRCSSRWIYINNK
jgi:hypothetical protein